MRYFVGIDGGGTRTTLGISDESGREILRQVGPAGIVDPRRTDAAAESLVKLVREAAQKAGLDGPAAGLCAGLAGVGHPAERESVAAALLRAEVAHKVIVLPDGETAFQGALGGGAGILVIAGTGSVAYGRSEAGVAAKCGGWGRLLGDEGSAYDMGRAGLRSGLLAADERGPPTQLLDQLLGVLGLPDPDAVPPWAERAAKAEVAMLAVEVLRLSREGDVVAMEIVAKTAQDLVAHVVTLISKLGPWNSPPAVVLYGGLAADPIFNAAVKDLLTGRDEPVRVVPFAADAVTGALAYARGEVHN